MKKLIVSATAAIFAAGSALAQLPVKPSASPEEIQEKLQAAVKAEFDNADLNGDGELSQEEFVEYTIKGERNIHTFRVLSSHRCQQSRYNLPVRFQVLICVHL